MTVDENACRPGVLGDTWGGWVVFLMASCALLYSVVSVLFDGRHPVVTSSGRIVVQATGRYGTVVALVALAGAVACAAFALISRYVLSGRLGAAVTLPLVLLLSWGAHVAWLRGDGFAGIAEAVLALMLALAVVVSCPTRATLHRLSTLRDLLAAGSLVYSALAPSVAQGACRPDKCGVFGSLWYGLFENENAAGASIALLLPTLLTAGRARLVLSVALAVVFVGATGSRTAFAAAAVAVLFLVTTRTRLARGARPALVWRLFPGAGLVVSLLLFLGAAGQDLTGRGTVYALIKERLADPTAFLIGAGAQALEGLIGGWVMSAHGEAPHVLVMFGLPGLGLLFLALGQLPLVRDWTWARVAGLGVLATASARFPTESGLVVGLRTTEMALLLLTIGLFATPRSGAVRRREAGSDTAANGRTPRPSQGVLWAG